MNRLTTFIMAFALLMLMGKAQATIIASARGDYADGINAGDLAILGATGSGTWTYLSSDTANPSLDGDGLPIMAWDPLASNGTWLNLASLNTTEPQILGNNAILAPDEILIHPQNFLQDPPYGVARWTAGAGEAGLIRIVGNVRDLDLGGGDGVTFGIFSDGTSVFSPGVINTAVGESFDILTTVSIGSTVDFVVGPIGFADFDSTGLSATITPEPSSLTLLVLGTLGMCAYGWRRRRRV